MHLLHLLVLRPQPRRVEAQWQNEVSRHVLHARQQLDQVYIEALDEESVEDAVEFTLLEQIQ